MKEVAKYLLVGFGLIILIPATVLSFHNYLNTRMTYNRATIGLSAMEVDSLPNTDRRISERVHIEITNHLKTIKIFRWQQYELDRMREHIGELLAEVIETEEAPIIWVSKLDGDVATCGILILGETPHRYHCRYNLLNHVMSDFREDFGLWLERSCISAK
jgi:hypothetical protein